MTLYYECSDGTIINFISDTISPEEPETLLRNEWNYSTISGVGGIARIKRFYKDAQESELKLQILADNAEQYNDLMREMHRCFERDVRTLQPGKIWWNDFYKEIFVVEAEYEEFEELMESVVKKIGILSVSPYWTRKHSFTYSALVEVVGTLDYPFDYGFDFGTGYDYDRADVVEFLDNTTVYDSNFELIFYGPCDNPQIVIGGHYYTLYTDLATGEYATVNSRSKKIRKFSNNGAVENIFHTRDKSSYIFEKIPSGVIPVNKAQTLGVDIILYDERGEPEWI